MTIEQRFRVLSTHQVFCMGRQSQRKKYIDFFVRKYFYPLFVNIPRVLQFRIMGSHVKKYSLKDPDMVTFPIGNPKTKMPCL